MCGYSLAQYSLFSVKYKPLIQYFRKTQNSQASYFLFRKLGCTTVLCTKTIFFLNWRGAQILNHAGTKKIKFYNNIVRNCAHSFSKKAIRHFLTCIFIALISRLDCSEMVLIILLNYISGSGTNMGCGRRFTLTRGKS